MLSSPADKRIAWCEKNIRVKGRRPFRITPERDWIRQYFRALEGFKAWPVGDDFDALCPACSALAESIVDHPDDLEPCDDCPGLYAEPILFIFLAGDRRTGKTASFFAAAIEACTNEKNFEALYLATTDDQTRELAKDHCVNTIEASGMLGRKWSLATSQNKYSCKGNRSLIRVSAPTMKAAGKGVELLGIDEAREFPGHIFAVLLPTIQDTHGVKCMTCRRKIYGEKNYHQPCPTDGCEGRLRRFFGRVVISSNAAIIKDDPQRDWYADILRAFQHQGVIKNAYVFSLDDATKFNPDVSIETKSASIELMTLSPGLKSFIASEMENRDTRSGEDWLADYEVDLAVNRKWLPTEVPTGRLIGFFDTADVTELLSIFLLEDITPPEENDPFEYLRIVDYVVWDPQDLECPVSVPGIDNDGRPRQVVDPDLVYGELAPILRRYPTLAYLGVDVRLRPWAQKMVRMIHEDKKNFPKGHVVYPFNGLGEERNLGWDELATKLTSGRLQIPNDLRLISELKNARVVFKKGYSQVRETNRRTLHLDLAENLATVCYLAFKLGNKLGKGFGTSNPSHRGNGNIGRKMLSSKGKIMQNYRQPGRGKGRYKG